MSMSKSESEIGEHCGGQSAEVRGEEPPPPLPEPPPYDPYALAKAIRREGELRRMRRRQIEM